MKRRRIWALPHTSDKPVTGCLIGEKAVKTLTDVDTPCLPASSSNSWAMWAQTEPRLLLIKFPSHDNTTLGPHVFERTSICVSGQKPD